MRTTMTSLALRWGLTLTAAACASAAIAQKDTFPSQPPADLSSRPFVLPKTETRTLANGLKVIVAESKRVPIVTVRLGVRAGSVLDPPDQPRLAGAVAAQMTAGTDKYSSLQLREAAEEIGGSVGVSAGDDTATVSGTALSENVDKLMELMGQVVLHPTFPENELALYKGLATQSLTVQRQNPDFLANEQLMKTLYPQGHPYQRVSATPASIQSLTRQKLVEFHRQYYVPAGAVMVIVGDVKPSETISLVERAFGSWTGSGASMPTPPAASASSGRRIYLIDRPGSVQSNILIGNLGIKRSDPDAIPLNLANSVLGGGSTSRLYLNVREKHGYAYDVHSTSSVRQLSGEFTEVAQTRTDVTADAIKEMLADAQTVRAQPVTAEELTGVKNYIKGRFVMQMTSQSGLADMLLSQQMYGLPADYISAYRERVDAVTLADIQRVAQKYIQPDQAAIVVVGDASKLRTALAQVGEVVEVK